MKILNSYDTWHGKLPCVNQFLIITDLVHLAGTKNVTKTLAKMTKGKGIDVINDELLYEPAMVLNLLTAPLWRQAQTRVRSAILQSFMVPTI